MTSLRDLQNLRAEVRTWLDENVPGNIPAPRRGASLPESLLQWMVEFRRNLGAKGWLAPSWPTYFGGGGYPPAASRIIYEEIGRRPMPSIPINQVWLTPLRVWGTEEQKAKWLTPTLRGEITVNQVLSEPSGGSDLSRQETMAIRNGDRYLVNGEKGPSSNPYPPDYLFILVTTDPEGRKYENLSMIVVDAHDPGVSVTTRRTLMGGEHRIFAFQDVWTPAENIIGGEGNGWNVAQTLLDVERGGVGVTRQQQQEVEERERHYWGGRA